MHMRNLVHMLINYEEFVTPRDINKNGTKAIKIFQEFKMGNSRGGLRRSATVSIFASVRLLSLSHFKTSGS